MDITLDDAKRMYSAARAERDAIGADLKKLSAQQEKLRKRAEWAENVCLGLQGYFQERVDSNEIIPESLHEVKLFLSKRK